MAEKSRRSGSYHARWRDLYGDQTGDNSRDPLPAAAFGDLQAERSGQVYHLPGPRGASQHLHGHQPGFLKTLPEAAKKAVTDDKKAIEVYLANGKAYQAYDDKALTEAYKLGIKNITLPDSEIKEARRIGVEVWDMVGAKDPYSKKAVETWKRYVADKGLM